MSLGSVRIPYFLIRFKTDEVTDAELNQLSGIAAILTFPLDVEVVEAEEREAAEEQKRKEEEEAKVSIYLARNDPVLKRSARKHPENHHRSSSSRSRRYSLHAACSLLTWKA